MEWSLPELDGRFSARITTSTKQQARNDIQALIRRLRANLVIIDVAFDASSLTLHACGPKSAIEEDLSALPAHEGGIARIFDCGYKLDTHQLEHLEQHLKNVYGNSTRISNLTMQNGRPLYDLESVASQWNSENPVSIMVTHHNPRLPRVTELGSVKCLPIEQNRLLGEQI